MTDYEKLYKEAIERARKINSAEGVAASSDWTICEVIFPELKEESESERIRKEIIDFIYDKTDTYELREKSNSWLAWLEKQGGSIKEHNVCETCEEQASCVIPCPMKLVEKQNPVEPKFHKGEWITNGDYTWKIVEIKPLDYILQSQDGNIIDDTISYVDEQFHSFTIEDAKDGDVIFYSSGWTCIFKRIHGIWYSSYCFITADGEFNTGYEEHYVGAKINGNANPATKEQRDTLMKAMADAGYTFDFDKKELKKIEQNPADKVEPRFKVGDFIANDYCMGKVVEITNDAYLLDTEQGIPFYSHSIRLWDITKDAKDGDVLYSLDSNQPFIYKERNGYEQATAYCGLNIYGKFFVWGTKDCVITLSNYVPSTKEQRELLFQKMKEAGYEWSDKDRKLIKIVK